jgi:flagellar biosynthesis/type III secretory pathway chaperone
MTAARTADSPLRENLDQHLACAAALEQLLAEEKAALTANDLAGLEQLCAAKSAAAQSLQALSQRLYRLCGCSDAAGIERHLRSAGGEAALAQWQELLRRAGRCQQANLENGALLLERRTRVRSMLQLIRRGEQPLYGPGGQAPTGAERRALASA